jgi:hypothetical protein
VAALADPADADVAETRRENTNKGRASDVA